MKLAARWHRVLLVKDSC